VGVGRWAPMLSWTITCFITHMCCCCCCCRCVRGRRLLGTDAELGYDLVLSLTCVAAAAAAAAGLFVGVGRWALMLSSTMT
jgi:hypothetical protein